MNSSRKTEKWAKYFCRISVILFLSYTLLACGKEKIGTNASNVWVSAFPNPFVNEVNLYFTKTDEDEAEIKIINDSGELIELTTTEDRIRIDANEWEAGIYNFEVLINNNLFVHRIAKIQ